jgi:hypothetical protein
VIEKSPPMPPKPYLQGLTLWEALSCFGDAESIEVESFNYGSEPADSVAPKQTGGMLAILNMAFQGLQDIQRQRNDREKIETILKSNFLDLIKKGDLIPFGFKMPRNIQDQPVKIPPDLFFGGEVNWQDSELKSQSLEFSGIRIFENTGTILDLSPSDSESQKNKIKNKPYKNTEEKKISELALDAHIGEKEAAKLLGISPRTLQGYRLKGGGPKYRKIGNRIVRYRVQDLIDWSDESRKENTSQN